jgi:hypothetical protein
MVKKRSTGPGRDMRVNMTDEDEIQYQETDNRTIENRESGGPKAMVALIAK